MSEEELKPCPFCGNTNLHHTETSIFHAVWCKDCGAMVDIDDGDAIKLWNTRPLEDALQKRIAELEEQLLKVSKEYAEMSFARRVNKHNETIRVR